MSANSRRYRASVVKWAALGSSLLVTAASTETLAGAKDILTGITIVSYSATVEPVLEDERCKVDWAGLNTSIDFIANQSKTLKFVTEFERGKEVMSRLKNQPRLPKSGDEAEWTEWKKGQEEFRTYDFMPRFHVLVSTAGTQTGCVAEVLGTLEAVLEASKVVATGRAVPYPSVQIWTSSRWVRAPYNSFSDSVTRSAEQLLKEFVNDWAASQK